MADANMKRNRVKRFVECGVEGGENVVRLLLLLQQLLPVLEREAFRRHWRSNWKTGSS